MLTRISFSLTDSKFVRIRPNSVLENLYPPSRHAPDRCLVCGHSFDNHLKSWWFPHIYSSFDQHITQDYKQYTVDRDEIQPKRRSTNRNQKHQCATRQEDDRQLRPMYNDLLQPFRIRQFHKRYVEEIDDSKKKKRITHCTKRISSSRSTSSHSYHRENKLKNKMKDEKLVAEYEERQIYDVKYRVPSIDVSKCDMGTALTLATTRLLVLERLDSLIWLENLEERWYNWRKQKSV